MTTTLIDHRPSGTASAGPVPPAEVPHDLDRPVTRTVGRDRLLARIEQELDRARPVSLRGGRGVGKTRLLAELRARHVGPVQLLAGLEVAGGSAAAPTVRDRPEGDRSLLVLVDDAQQLPSLEVARLHALQGQPWCRVVTTVSTEGDAQGPATLGRWWLADRWRSLEVAPLSRTATAELLAEVLGGLPEPRLVHAVWRATGGHPVAAVELVREAYELGCITPGADSWRLVAPLPVGRLTALVGDRLSGLSEAARHDLRVLAFASPLPIRVASGLLRPTAIRELEGRGLVRFRADRTGRTLSIVDAVHAEVVRAGLDPDARDRLLREVADVLDRCGPTAGVDLEVARWRLQVGGWSPQDLGAAAARARCAGETSLAESLADAAVRDGAGPAAVRVRALATVERRAGWAVTDEDAPVGPAVDTDAAVWAQAQAIGAGRWSQAVARLEGSVATRGYAAVLAALGGRPATAAHLLEDAPEGTLAATAALLVAAARGDADAVERAASRIGACEAGDDLLPVATDLVRGHRLLVDDEDPLEERLERAAGEVDRALRRLSASTAWWFAIEGWLRWEHGDLDGARRRLTSALLACTEADPIRLRPLLLADLALLSAQTGAVIEAQWRLSQVGDDRGTNPAVSLRCEVAALLVAARGTPGVLDVDALIRLAEQAVQDGRDRDAAWVCHLAVRFARSETARVPDPRLAGADPLVAAHLTARAARDGEALDAVARRFAADGRRLVAAEAAAAAASLGAGERSEALAAALVAGCPAATTPPVAGLGPVRISPRRRDAAVLAMHGYDDRRIAAELGLSVRTVENHLAKVYRQVGVTGRGELTALFDPSCAPFDRAALAGG